MSNYHYDLTLCIGKTEFRTLKGPLAKHSPVFRTMFEALEDTKGKIPELTLARKDPTGFILFLRLLNLGLADLPYLQEEDTKAVYDFAVYYDVQFILNSISQRLIDGLITEVLYHPHSISKALWILTNFPQGFHLIHAVECIAWARKYSQLSPAELKGLTSAVKDQVLLTIYNRKSFVRSSTSIPSCIEYLDRTGTWISCSVIRSGDGTYISLPSGDIIKWDDIAWYQLGLPGSRITPKE